MGHDRADFFASSTETNPVGKDDARSEVTVGLGLDGIGPGILPSNERSLTTEAAR